MRSRIWRNSYLQAGCVILRSRALWGVHVLVGVVRRSYLTAEEMLAGCIRCRCRNSWKGYRRAAARDGQGRLSRGIEAMSKVRHDRTGPTAVSDGVVSYAYAPNLPAVRYIIRFLYLPPAGGVPQPLPLSRPSTSPSTNTARASRQSCCRRSSARRLSSCANGRSICR